MPGTLQRLRLAAVNIDGVLLNDTFSPVIHHFIVSRGGKYTADVERRIFSQGQRIASRALATACGGGMSAEEALEAYFAERSDHLAHQPVALTGGAVELLRRLRELGLRTVCYGGLDRSHFDRHLGDLAGLFDEPGYVCTDAFRPGIREITTEVFGLAYDQVVFIDDVARVAEEARSLGAAFIGHPSSFEHGFQRELMRAAGVRHLVDSLDGIEASLLRAVDAEAEAGTVWRR
ncbi:HAD family phosphatase [Streptomyces sp. NBC_01262]|uniref:HAD family phosphatase n=1 Tax=Streptomyces sp. NBC_01262 TaxID=2903803 RepID=UPI002E325D89|nr:HAD family phosphatase [Streptomyces sp. NBC_01262]